MHILLVRHAQSEWQVNASEDLDSPLTPVGHEQARQLARWLANERGGESICGVPIGHLCSSPYLRARQTASYVSEALALTTTIERNLEEAPFHVASDLPIRDAPFGATSSYVPSDRYRKFRTQAEAALRTLVDGAGSYGVVLAVTHGGLIKTLLRTIVDNDAVCFRLYNACLNLIEWRRGRWHLVHLNLWDHLSFELRTE